MDTKKYEVFEKTVELSSLTKAAEELGLTQSGVSHIIAALEEEVARIDSRMEEFSSDYEKLMELESARAETEKQLDEKMEEWERLSESVQG